MSGNTIWLYELVSVLEGEDAWSGCECPSEMVKPSYENMRGLPNLQLEAGVVKPGQRRRAVMRGGLRTLSRRGSGVRIPAPAPKLRTPRT